MGIQHSCARRSGIEQVEPPHLVLPLACLVRHLHCLFFSLPRHLLRRLFGYRVLDLAQWQRCPRCPPLRREPSGRLHGKIIPYLDDEGNGGLGGEKILFAWVLACLCFNVKRVKVNIESHVIYHTSSQYMAIFATCSFHSRLKNVTSMQ